MFSRIESLTEKKLVGKTLEMSFAENKTRELWQSFMPTRKAVKNIEGTDLYSIEIYEPSYFNNFDPTKPFIKGAAIAVSTFMEVPEDLESIVIPAGTYAVFIHKGPASEALKTYEYIFNNWIPASTYLLDNRPHFAIMGNKYRHEDAASAEEIWIPIRLKLNV